MVYFAGETLHDGMEADEVYVLLNSMYIQNFNNNFVVPIDYKYYQSLAGDIGSRMYEILSIWFYPALENGKKYIDKKYSELCEYFPLTRQDTKWKAKKQLKSAYQQHLSSGFFASEPKWIDINEKDDWLIRYWIGPRAKDWHQQNKKLGNMKGDIKQIATPRQGRGEKSEEIRKESEEVINIAKDQFKENPLITQLISLGVTQKVAEDLVEHSHPKAVQDWIGAIHETKAKDKAAYLVKAIQENWELPEVFKKKKEEQEKQRVLISKEKIQNKIVEEYNMYKKIKINSYIKKITPEEKEQELERIEQELYEKYPIAKTWHGPILKSTLEGSFLEEVKEKVKILPFEEWLKKSKNPKPVQTQLFEVEKMEQTNTNQQAAQTPNQATTT